ncbi:MAG TPA: carboxypeptidase-like regulatory domain-containing protein [Alphaproteobacteria bacterium]|nr:carboxypeptidase-like regulatory domain-containing protein [Alphaproteobacteria bacterium]
MAINKTAVAVLALALLGITAHAQQPMQPQTQNGIAFVSGGISIEERQAMQAMEGSYNLRLLFVAEPSGEYLWGVKVELMDGSGKTLLKAVSDGPYFLAKLSPGRYTVIAADEKRAIKKSVEIAPGKAVSERFSWPSS